MGRETRRDEMIPDGYPKLRYDSGQRATRVSDYDEVWKEGRKERNLYVYVMVCIFMDGKQWEIPPGMSMDSDA